MSTPWRTIETTGLVCVDWVPKTMQLVHRKPCSLRQTIQLSRIGLRWRQLWLLPAPRAKSKLDTQEMRVRCWPSRICWSRCFRLKSLGGMYSMLLLLGLHRCLHWPGAAVCLGWLLPTHKGHWLKLPEGRADSFAATFAERSALVLRVSLAKPSGGRLDSDPPATRRPLILRCVRGAVVIRNIQGCLVVFCCQSCKVLY